MCIGAYVHQPVLHLLSYVTFGVFVLLLKIRFTVSEIIVGSGDCTLDVQCADPQAVCDMNTKKCKCKDDHYEHTDKSCKPSK